MGCVEFPGVDGCGFVGAVGQVVVDLLVQWAVVFWVVGRRLWVMICALFVSFLVGMVGCEDVFEISNEFDFVAGVGLRGGSRWRNGGSVVAKGGFGGEGCSVY